MTLETVRTLMIEDNQPFFETIRAGLNVAPCYRYFMVNVAKLMEAKALLKQHDFDLIIVDLNLPDRQGMATFEELMVYLDGVAQDKEATNTPWVRPTVVVLTGVDDDMMGVVCLQKGADEYLVKGRHPLEECRRLIRNAVVRNQAHQQLCPLEKILKKAEEVVEVCEQNPNLPPYTSAFESVKPFETTVEKKK
jgi:two-component system, cell cycle sensor histidine kinase and response regulator CckA